MKKLFAAALLLTVSCSSSDSYEPSTTPQPAGAASSTDATRVAELQTAMTELLERLDVLNDRIARLESAPPPAAPAPQVVASQPEPARSQPQPQRTVPRNIEPDPAPAQPQRALLGAQIAENYRNAIMLYGKNRVSDSRRAFQDVFDSDPTGELADNALFWIGETYFAAGDFNNAMRYYRRVTVEFGDQNKAPDAMFKTALALERTGDLALAKQTLQQVIEKYPYSTPAASAKHELTRLKF